MPFLDLAGEHFHYADVGAGPVFIFQHGLGSDISQPLQLHSHLPGWRMATMDCRGHGLTKASLAPELLSFRRFADDLCALCDELKIERAVVGGISMGAGVSLAFALAHPDRAAGLVLVRPAWLDRPYPANLRWFPLVAEYLRREPPEEAEASFRRSPEFSELDSGSRAASDSLLGQFRRPQASERAVVLSALPGSVPITNLAEGTRLNIPTLVIVNPRDPVHPACFGQSLTEAIPGAGLRQITSKADSAARHESDLADAVQEFLGPLHQVLKS